MPKAKKSVDLAIDFDMSFLPVFKAPELYQLEPLGRGTGDVESMDSYMCRLAKKCQTTYSMLLRNILTSASCIDEWTRRLLAKLKLPVRTETQRHRSIIHFTAERKCAEVIESMSGQDGLRECTGGALYELFSTHGLASRRLNYCVQCLKEDGGSPYHRLRWSIRGVVACEKHKIRLTDEDYCRGTPLQTSMKPRLPGVCRTCGSIEYKCHDIEPVSATEAELWIAEQVGEAINYLIRAGDEFLLRKGIADAASILGDGKPYASCWVTGIPKSVLNSWIRGDIYPDFERLLKMLELARIPIVSVLEGAPYATRTPSVLSPKRPGKLRTPAKNVRIEAMVDSMIEFPPKTLRQVADHLGVDPHTLRTDHPELSGKVIKAARLWRRNRDGFKTYKRMVAVIAACSEMTTSGEMPSLRKIRDATGLPLRPEKVERHLAERLIRKGLQGQVDAAEVDV